MRHFSPLAAMLVSLAPLPAHAAPPAPDLSRGVEAILAEAGPGTRWGVVVADADGREVLAIDPEGRFMPASNTKIYTTAAAMWSMMNGKGPEPDGGGASVALVPASRGAASDVVLAGHGDARLLGAADCTVDCLAQLADAVAAKARRVHDVIGDDTAFPDQRWSPGMSWNNMPTSSGTGISALTIDDNEIAATVTPAATPDAPPVVAVPAYYTVENHARTVPGTETTIAFDRMPASRLLVVTGTIGAGHGVQNLRLGVDDPADYAAWQLAGMLRARGVKVTGQVLARHRPLMPEDDPETRGDAPVALPPGQPALATLTPAPLAEDIVHINKVSQNLHAELLLRRLSRIAGSGSIADGQVVVRAMLDVAGVTPNEASFSDGSGMSSYNRVAPRGTVKLLTWIAHQPWGEAWRATLPVGGEAGSTLRARFAGTPLQGKLWAKTGSLNATNALAGYMATTSGKRLIFAIYANDVPDDVKATAIMDRALEYVAANE